MFPLETSLNVGFPGGLQETTLARLSWSLTFHLQVDRGVVSSDVCASCEILAASSYSWEVTEAWGGEAHGLAPLWLGKAE